MSSVRSKQRGLVGVLLLVTIAVMAVAVFSKNIWGEDSRTYQAKVNTQALAQAKAALLDYLVTGDIVNGDTSNSGSAYDPFTSSSNVALGRLPCPNQDGNGKSASSCGPDSTNIGAGFHSLGLFPWATVNSPAIRDAARQCLWYAVDGAFKYDRSGSTGHASSPINSDSYGSFSVVQPVKPTNASLLATTWPTQLVAGDTTTVGNSPDRVIAVIIAAGAAGGIQTQTSIGGAAYTCGLTRTSAATGLPDAQTSAVDFLKYYSSTLNNQSMLPASGAPAANIALYSARGGTPTATPTQTLKTFVTADIEQTQLNDQVTWITAAEFSAAATKRIAGLYSGQINAYAAATGFYPWAASAPKGACVSGLLQGYVPYTCQAAPASGSTLTDLGFGAANFFNDTDYWAGQAHYAVALDCSPSTASTRTISGTTYPRIRSSLVHPCTASDGINLNNGNTSSQSPAAILLMRGRAINGQSCSYDGTQTTSSNAKNMYLCLEPTNTAGSTTPSNSLTVKNALSNLPSSGIQSANMYANTNAKYFIPSTSGGNDYLVQFTKK